MKFLLVGVNAKYIHSNPAIYSLRAYCMAKNPGLAEHTQLAEYTINQPQEQILGDIYRRKPDAVGFSCYIWNWECVQSLAAELFKLCPGIPIWLGGPEVSYDGPALLERMPFLAGIMIGEGEETFRELLEFYLQEQTGSGGKKPEDIAGLLFRRDRIGNQAGDGDCPGKNTSPIVRTAKRPLTELSDIPFFYDSEDMERFQDRILYYESSRGCPYRCSYCLSSIDKKVRLRSMELVKRELQFFLDHQVSQVKFVDRTFNCSHAHAMEIWRYIRDHDNGVTNFHFEIAGDILTEEELALLKTLRPGLVQLEIGVQTTNPQTLQKIRRITDWEHLKRVIRDIRDGRNIHIHLDLIAGLPCEDLESFRHSFNDVYSCRPQQLQLGFLKVLKGSYMQEAAAEYGLVYTDRPPYEVLYTKWLSYEDILLLKQVEEMVELYYNSNQFTRTLPVLEECFSDPFEMYRQLAGFYEENGYFTRSPSRTWRYQVLLDFALRTDPGRERQYRQLLTLDMYLRENMKSRPAFALPLTEEAQNRQRIAEFYRKEAENPGVLKDYVQQGCDSRQMARMTHIECFEEPIWRERKETKNGQLYWLLFDYQRRSPLNRDARITELTLQGVT